MKVKTLIITFALAIFMILGFSQLTNAQFRANTIFSCKTDSDTGYPVNKYRINNVSAKTFIIWNRSLGAFARERCQLVAQVLEANKGNFLYLTDAHDSNMNKVICADKEERDGQSKKCDEQRTVIRAEYNSPGLLEKIKDSVVKGGSPAQSNSIYKEYLDTSWIDWRSFIRNIDEENDE